MISANYADVTEFKERNPAVDLSQFSDTTLSGTISRASGRVDDFLGYSLSIETITGEKAEGVIDSDLNLCIWPRKRPIVSVSALSIVKGNDSITLSLTDGTNDRYDILDDKQFVYPDAALSLTSVSIIDSFSALRGTRFYTELTYRAGYVTVPGCMVSATDLYVLDELSRQHNTSGALSLRQGGIAITYDNSGVSQFVRQAESLLQDYRRIAGF